jgi:stringent starvation protein B
MAERRLSSRRPYLIRAMREWMIDNDLTPHIVVNADLPEVEVPRSFVREGRIVLNISDAATDAIALGNDHIAFSARFGGTPCQVCVPIGAVMGIYARETEQGMLFGAEPEDEAASGALRSETGDDPPEGDGPPAGGGGGRPHLKVVK